MQTDAQWVSGHFTELARLAERLAGRNRAIYRHSFDYMHFGSWVLEAGTRKRRVRVTWDGRESILSASVTEYGDSPGPDWEPLSERRFERASPFTLFEAAEEIIAEYTSA